jgi:nucleoid DNA-binding protein
MLDKIIDGLVKESRIELRRFGVFAVKQQGPRVITLPSGKKIKRPAQKVVTFAPGAAVKKKLNPKTSKKK